MLQGGLLCRQVVPIALASLFGASAINAQTVIHVDDDAPLGGDGTSWPTAYRFVQDALYIATDGDEIHVAGGTYKPDQDEVAVITTGDREATFELVDGVSLIGGYAGLAELGDPDRRDIETYETILSGDLLDDDGPGLANRLDNAKNVVDASYTDSTALLDGFHIASGGYAPEYHPDGAGLYNYRGEPIIRNCTFSKNAAYGGGAVINDYQGDAAYIDCTFRNNHGGVAGAIYNYRSSPSYLRCTFHENTSIHTSGAVFNSVSSATYYDCQFLYNRSKRGGATDNQGYRDETAPLFDHCIFLGNHADEYGGAIHNISYASPMFRNCVFLGNSAGSDGGALYSHNADTVVVSNCLVTGNTATRGGAFYNGYSTLWLHSSTIAANRATDVVGGVYSPNSSSILEIVNSVLWGNLDADGSDEGAQIMSEDGAVTITYSDIQGWTGVWGGTGNTGLDPLFADAYGLDDIPGTEDDDLRLTSGSPAIDAGDNTVVPEDVTTDLDGNSRFVDDRATPDTGSGIPPIVDMGAYEYQATCGVGVVDLGEECDGTNDQACPGDCISPGSLRACRCEPRGACCDGTDGTCANGTYGDECVGEQQIWHQNEECESLDPPCERHTGACCDSAPGSGGTCTDGTYPEQCTGSHWEWFKDTLCIDVSCFEDSGACCDRTSIFGGCIDDVLAEDCLCEMCDWSKETACEEIECVKNPIPTVSEWGLVVMTLLLLAGGKLAFRQTRAVA